MRSDAQKRPPSPANAPIPNAPCPCACPRETQRRRIPAPTDDIRVDRPWALVVELANRIVAHFPAARAASDPPSVQPPPRRARRPRAANSGERLCPASVTEERATGTCRSVGSGPLPPALGPRRTGRRQESPSAQPLTRSVASTAPSAATLVRASSARAGR